MVSRDIKDSSRNRLSIMEKTNDGFIIADEDLKLRGPGQFFGLKQSGFFQYKIANMVTDGALIREARKSAFTLAENDPGLNESTHELMKKTFIKNYSQHLDSINLS